MSNTVKRHYSEEISAGTIFKNTKNNRMWIQFDLGVFQYNVGLQENSDGAYDLIKSKLGSEKDENGNPIREFFTVGKTFIVTDKSNNKIDGITQGTLSLTSGYDSEKKKKIYTNDNAFYFSTHQLKEEVAVGSNDTFKIGYVKGQFGIKQKEN